MEFFFLIVLLVLLVICLFFLIGIALLLVKITHHLTDSIDELNVQRLNVRRLLTWLNIENQP